MTPQMRANWARYRRDWPEQAKADLQRGLSQHRAAVLANPGAYRDDVNRFLKAVTDSHGRLTRLKPHVDAGNVDRAKYEQCVRQYEILGAGLFSGAYEADEPSVAGPPVLLIIGGIGFIAAAIIWAVVAWQQARVLDHQTTVMETELEARIRMNAQGLELQPTTLTFPEDAPIVDASGMSTGALLGLGALGLLAGAGGLLWFTSASK